MWPIFHPPYEHLTDLRHSQNTNQLQTNSLPEFITMWQHMETIADRCGSNPTSNHDTNFFQPPSLYLPDCRQEPLVWNRLQSIILTCLIGTRSSEGRSCQHARGVCNFNARTDSSSRWSSSYDLPHDASNSNLLRSHHAHNHLVSHIQHSAWFLTTGWAS